MEKPINEQSDYSTEDITNNAEWIMMFEIFLCLGIFQRSPCFNKKNQNLLLTLILVIIPVYSGLESAEAVLMAS